MSDYRMIAGIVSFIVIVMAILGAASVDYPEVSPVAPGAWPPTFDLPNPPSWTTIDCDSGIFGGIECVAAYLGAFVRVLWEGLVYITTLAWEIIVMVGGLLQFRIPTLPSELEWINTILTVGTIFVLAIFVFRIARSVIPFVSGE